MNLKNIKPLIKTFNRKYFAAAMAILIVEIYIALFVHDKIIRPYIGDVLVVVLIYCFVKSFFPFPYFKTAIAVLLFAFITETLQYFQFIKLVGLEHSTMANIIIGNSFSKLDLVAYTVGVLIVLLVEKFRHSI